MPHFKITVAYDGAALVGWQRQPSGVSIQSLLEDALATLDKRPVTVAGAGRTDAGVHALGQVAAFELRRDHNQINRIREECRRTHSDAGEVKECNVDSALRDAQQPKLP